MHKKLIDLRQFHTFLKMANTRPLLDWLDFRLIMNDISLSIDGLDKRWGLGNIELIITTFDDYANKFSGIKIPIEEIKYPFPLAVYYILDAIYGKGYIPDWKNTRFQLSDWRFALLITIYALHSCIPNRWRVRPQPELLNAMFLIPMHGNYPLILGACYVEGLRYPGALGRNKEIFKTFIKTLVHAQQDTSILVYPARSFTIGVEYWVDPTLNDKLFDYIDVTQRKFYRNDQEVKRLVDEAFEIYTNQQNDALADRLTELDLQ